jgi:hypothetical protein
MEMVTTRALYSELSFNCRLNLKICKFILAEFSTIQLISVTWTDVFVTIKEVLYNLPRFRPE